MRKTPGPVSSVAGRISGGQRQSLTPQEHTLVGAPPHSERRKIIYEGVKHREERTHFVSVSRSHSRN